MKIIIDECLPKRLTKLFPNDEAWTVPQIGLAGFKDTELPLVPIILILNLRQNIPTKT